ncbi:hypothetical protein B0H67DRAFT_567838 [Lasiosphaeris hirsuta]|uniref:Uncharacterized protein n=1 Tax=Lasiosphaeris hirsuta TaxID=260670 RepID=A0AA40E6M3_9PEZI|nr:hypothetical protein B0H67DRAFT_567838 [Lasiosphaeris hirsuta]
MSNTVISQTTLPLDESPAGRRQSCGKLLPWIASLTSTNRPLRYFRITTRVKRFLSFPAPISPRSCTTCSKTSIARRCTPSFGTAKQASKGCWLVLLTKVLNYI